MFGKPKEFFSIIQDQGTLRIGASKQASRYYLVFTALHTAIFLGLLGWYLIVLSPPTKAQWGVVILLTPLAGLGIALIISLCLRKDYFFDRITDRLLRGDKFITRLGNIDSLRLRREQDPSRPRSMLCLSLNFKDGASYQMYSHSEPMPELFKIAEAISKFLKVPLHPVEEWGAVLADLKRQFRKWELFVAAQFVFYWILTLFPWWWLLQELGAWVPPDSPKRWITSR